MHKTKILHIIKSLGRGGAEVLLPETLKLHDRSRFEFHYIYFLPWKDQMVQAIKDAGGKVTCISAKNNFQMLQKSNSVISYCKDNNIELIHCHLPWSGFLGRIIYNKTNIPLIYTEHNIQERYHLATKWLNKLTFNSQSFAIGVSEDVTRSIKKNIRPKVEVETILNGVNTEEFKRNSEKGILVRKEIGVPVDSIVIGNIAVFREQKALLDWIRAFKKIHQEYPEVYGILVGAGPQEKEMRRLINELGLNEFVKLPGLQTKTVSYFSAMDIFMMSSAFEGLPIALLEAMSLNCAVVSTKAGGIVEVVRENKDGMLCEVGDWNMLATKAQNLVKEDETRKRLQTAARKRVEEKFSLAAMVEKLEDVYIKFSENDHKRS